MRSSMWNSSHQNGADFCTVLDCIIDSIILLCRSWNRFLFFPFKNCLHVDRKWGGSWS
jgi:hypothetical protein